MFIYPFSKLVESLYWVTGLLEPILLGKCDVHPEQVASQSPGHTITHIQLGTM